MSAHKASIRISRVFAYAIVGLVTIFPAVTNAQTTPSPSPSTAITEPSEAAQALLSQFAAAWTSVTAYTATVSVFESKGAQTQNVVLEYTFRKPSNVTVHIDAGPNAGVTAVWDGGTTVVAHRGSGFAALFKKSLALHDPQITTIRGSSIDELSFGAILAHAQQQPGVLTQTAPATTADGNIETLNLIPANPAADGDLTREVVQLSATSHLPVQILGYDGTTLVRQITFTNVNLQP